MFTQIQNFKQLDYTSDHVWRSLDFKLGEQMHRVITWNLLYRCYNKAESRWGHANNPLNCSETMEEYEERKKQQIGEIVQLCYGSTTTPGADFLLFQDIYQPEWARG